MTAASELAPPALRIQLLGSFRVWVGSSAVESEAWRLRKAATLVKLLALAQTHRLHREQVLDLLWPDLDPQAAANNLHHVLHTARRLLAPAGSASPFLRLQADLLILAPASDLWVDVEAFEAAAAQARRGSDPGAYRTALALYQGDLLPEDLYEEWAADQREGLRSLYLSLLLELAGLCDRSGQVRPAIDALQRAVSHDRTCEEAHTGLMRFYARTGQRQGALRQYAQLQTALREELDTEPEDASQVLYQEILAGRVPRSPAPDVQLAQATPVTRAHNLPAALTSFIGREEEMAELERLLGTSRLVTMTGTGGSGKTRIALETAGRVMDRYPDGVWLVELASLADPALIPGAVASVMEIAEQPGQSLLPVLITALQTRQLLLILDNCEHLIDACAQLAADLLRSCPQLQILATSREPLQIDGEVTALVPPLTLPVVEHSLVEHVTVGPWIGALSVDELVGCDAIRLFVERAQYRQPSFLVSDANAGAVIEICYRLEGIPLAIELAAARMGALSVEQIASRLHNALGLLTAGSRTALSRQQTLRGTLDWSYDLLGTEERTLFTQLAVCAGGWDLETAEAIGGGDVLDPLSRLVDKSLVVAEAGNGEVRYRYLEPIRQYAHARLVESGLLEAAKRRHAEHFVPLAEEDRPRTGGTEQATWLGRLEQEHDNFRAALVWTETADPALGFRLISRLWYSWYFLGHLKEGREWLDRMFAACSDPPPAQEIMALRGIGALDYAQGDYGGAAAALERAMLICRETGDEVQLNRSMNQLAIVVHNMGDYERAIALHEESLAMKRKLGDEIGILESLVNLGNVSFAQGKYIEAQERLEEALIRERQMGDTYMTGLVLNNLGDIADRQGDHLGAEARFRESLSIGQELGEKEFIHCGLDGLGWVAQWREQADRAVRLYAAARAIRTVIGATVHSDRRDYQEGKLTELRALMSDDRFAALWSDGQAMSMEKAVEYALSTQPSAEGDTAPAVPTATLTRREREIAALVARGLTNRQIAEDLIIAERTVDTHVSNILSKLNLTSRTQVAGWVAQQS